MAETDRKSTSFPRLFTTLKGFSETEAPMMSPTSILDISKPFSVLRNPFWPEPKTPEPPESRRHKLGGGSKGIGLGIVDVLLEEEEEDDDDNDHDPTKESKKPETRMVLFGSQLKIQIPTSVLSSSSPQDSPKSPGDFGIKTRNSFFSCSSSFSPATTKKSTFGSVNSGMETPNSPQVFTGCLSATEMELSEDYTCVISHGPNPKTTHIFDNCIVESCCGITGFSAFKKDNNEQEEFTSNDDLSTYPSQDFLSFCYSCKKNLGQGKDIYIYRGEKAFCSGECRYQEIMLEEGGDNNKNGVW